MDVKTEYGTGDTALNFGWEEDADGNPTFTQNPTAPIAPEIIYKYDSSAPVNEALEVTTDISDTPITGNFINLDKSNLNNRIYIHDGGKVSDLNGNFINIDIDNGRNWSDAEGEIGNLNGNFIHSPIVNWNGTIQKIKGNFIGSETSAIRSYSEYAGNEIGSIVGNFIGNRHGWYGGAIYNGKRLENQKSTIGSISGNFINNNVFNDSDDGTALGGAIYNTGNIGKESSQILDNAASQLDTAVQYASQTLINSETGESLTAYVALNSENRPLTAEQLGEYIASGGKVIRVAMTGTVDSAEFEERKESLEEYISGGYASTTPADIPTGNILTTDDIITSATAGASAAIRDSLFIGNHVKSVNGGAKGGAIYNDDLMGYKVTLEIDDEIKNTYVDIDFDKIVEEVQSIPSIQNSSFYNNYAESESGEAKGGAIYSTTDITIAANNGESIFSGNKVINNGVEESNAIYMGTNETAEYDSLH